MGYYEEKEKIRQEAIEWQYTNIKNYSYMDIQLKTWYFEEKAKKYGLIKEFKDNGII